MSVKSLRGAKSYVFFNDEYNKDCRVFFIKQKKEVSKCLHMCLNEVSTVGHRVKMSQCDDGKEFACEEVPQWLWCYIADVNAVCTWTERSCRMRTPYGCRARMFNAVSEQATIPMLAQACETAVYVLNHTENTSVIGWSPKEMCGMVTWWRTWIIYVCLALSVMHTSQTCFRRNLKTRVCLVEWSATRMIKMGTRFTWHLSTRLCTCMLSTSSQNEFASVQRMKRGWKMQLWKMWLRRTGMKMTQCQIHHSWSKSSRWSPRNSFPGTQDKQYTK